MKILWFCFFLFAGFYSAFVNASPKYFSLAQNDFAAIGALSDADYQWIASRIFQNEAASKTKYLTHWGKGEDFPSFGIAHFIWFPNNIHPPFEETFPAMVQFVSQSKLPPVWLLQRLDQGANFSAPWSSKAEFDAAQSSEQMQSLRAWLLESQAEQARFVAFAFKQRWLKEIASLPRQQQSTLNQQLQQMMAFKQGLFAVLDYFNFKGIGNNNKEQYQGLSWGLISVLQTMPNMDNATHKQLLADFIAAAKGRLTLRTELAPAERNEARWLKGWFKRLDDYQRAL